MTAFDGELVPLFGSQDLSVLELKPAATCLHDATMLSHACMVRLCCFMLACPTQVVYSALLPDIQTAGAAAGQARQHIFVSSPTIMDLTASPSCFSALKKVEHLSESLKRQHAAYLSTHIGHLSSHTAAHMPPAVAAEGSAPGWADKDAAAAEAEGMVAAAAPGGGALGPSSHFRPHAVAYGRASRAAAASRTGAPFGERSMSAAAARAQMGLSSSAQLAPHLQDFPIASYWLWNDLGVPVEYCISDR